MRMAAGREIEPVIDGTLPMSRVGEGAQKLIDRNFFGKIVLTPCTIP